MARKEKTQVQETREAQEVQGQSQGAQEQAQGASQETREAQEPQKKPVAYVYVGNQNRYEFEAEVDGEKRTFVLWRNMVYRNLPDCEAVRELIKKEELKPVYG
ncbi:MAG TPA: hypothetical protein ENJ40_07385 [Thermosulfurimonas dismutans]|uniref:Uncharacterized protein n=1 Tax=Thermosulfurimonas dismutans TaxID=999894 RepID=A0A7C3GL64_9BACT|nr:hypothetical protein [Thermosulfurimonas dismutans]